MQVSLFARRSVSDSMTTPSTGGGGAARSSTGSWTTSTSTLLPSASSCARTRWPTSRSRVIPIPASAAAPGRRPTSARISSASWTKRSMSPVVRWPRYAPARAAPPPRWQGMRVWQARTKSRTKSGTTRRSNVFRMACTDLAQRWPLGRRELQEPGPHLPGAPEIPDEARPERADLVGADEEPDVPGVGLPQEGAHPVGALFRIGRGEVFLELADGGVRPPKEVGPRVFVEERRRGRRQAAGWHRGMRAAHHDVSVRDQPYHGVTKRAKPAGSLSYWCSGRNKSSTVLTGANVASGTSTKTVFHSAIAPFQSPGRSRALKIFFCRARRAPARSFFPEEADGFAVVRDDVVDILEEHDVPAPLSERLDVVDQRSVAGHRDAPRSWPGPFEQPPELRLVPGGDGEVEPADAQRVAGRVGGLHQVFLERSARSVGIPVELEERLGKVRIAEPLPGEQGREHSPASASCGRTS